MPSRVFSTRENSDRTPCSRSYRSRSASQRHLHSSKACFLPLGRFCDVQQQGRRSHLDYQRMDKHATVSSILQLHIRQTSRLHIGYSHSLRPSSHLCCVSSGVSGKLRRGVRLQTLLFAHSLNWGRGRPGSQ